MVCEFPDGRPEIRHRSRILHYQILDKWQRMNQAAIVDSKHLDGALAVRREMKVQRPLPGGSRRGPSRTALPATASELLTPTTGIALTSAPGRARKQPTDISAWRKQFSDLVPTDPAPEQS